jgi:hypothetical protein
MADAARFPHLAPPFAIVGAAAGWLSAGLIQHPIISVPDSGLRLIAAGVAAGFAAAAGALIRRFCVGPRYGWEVDAPDPDARPRSDSWARHGLALLVAGAATGALVCAVREPESTHFGALWGVALTVPFLPVCAAVLSAARRAQRARLGSIVAASDRRAVWGILATALLVATLEALPDWHAPKDGRFFGPVPAAALVALSVACIAAVLGADIAAWRRAKRAMVPGLARREASDLALEDASVPRVDLGLGADLLAHQKLAGAVYRGRERALALVQGDPEQAFSALRRAIRRGAAGLAVAVLVVLAHSAANGSYALVRYEASRCELGNEASCGKAGLGALGEGLLPRDGALHLFERGCDQGDAVSCMSLARLYDGDEERPRDAALVAFFEYRAAQRGVCPEGLRLVRGVENVCVDPLLDPRH